MDKKRKLCEPESEPESESSEPEMLEEVDEEEEEEECSKEEEPAANGSKLEPESESEMRELLNPFTKDQLISLLTSAALSHPSLLRSIASFAKEDPAHRNIFIRSLPPTATSASLLSSFSRFGEIENAHVAVDKLTGASKCYGFVLFRSRAAARRALADPVKYIEGNTVTYQLAPCGDQVPASSCTSRYSDAGRKIYVGNVTADVDLVKLYEFFSTFGEIESGPHGLHHTTRRPWGYVMYVYKTREELARALEQPQKVFEGRVLNCRMANETTGKNTHFVPSPVGATQQMTPYHDAATPWSQTPLAPALPVKDDLSQAVNQAVNQALTAIFFGGYAPNVGYAAVSPYMQWGYSGSPYLDGNYGASLSESPVTVQGDVGSDCPPGYEGYSELMHLPKYGGKGNPPTHQ